jgi:hypothetical protein
VPDRPDLDARLGRSRADLLGEIDQPPLSVVRRRAGALRRRRTAVAGSALAVLVATGVVVLHPWSGPGGNRGAEPAAEASARPSAPVFRGAGITISGLDPKFLVDVPGTITDVEFVDPDHGYVVSQCPVGTPCPTVSVTDDGGLTFARSTLPDAARRDGLEVVAFPRGQALLAAGDATFATMHGGRSWQATPGGTGGASGRPVAATPDQILRYDGSGGVAVWDPVRGRLGQLRDGPAGIEVRWVAARAAGDGAWWVGGVAPDGAPAVSVTRDGGKTWKTTALTAAGTVSEVHVTALGREVFAVATGSDGALLGAYHSMDAGGVFYPTWTPGEPGPAKVLGDPVPLLDGRLLVAEPAASGTATGGAGGRWWVSDDQGRSFTNAAGLPAVGRLQTTAAGYVAYGLFAGGWTAYSTDGATWQKLQAN